LEQVLLKTVDVQHGRNRGMRHRVYGEASPYSGNAEKLPAEIALCKRIGDTLSHAYPGHPWMVSANSDQGIAQIGIPVLLGNWTWNFHMDKDITDEDVVRAGGEILERFKIPRSTIDIAAYLSALKSVPMIGRYGAKHGHLIPV
jgi:hypothetical protein